MALELRLTVEVTGGPEPLTLELPADAPAAWADPATNLLAQAYAAGCAAAGAASPTGRLRVTAPIPLARGLGSSAAAVVAGLAAAAAVHRHRPDPVSLLELATGFEGHPDNVAAALLGGCALTVRGGDGTLLARRIPVPRGLGAVLFVPDRELETRAARAVLPRSVGLAEAVFNSGRCALLVHALCSGELDCLGWAMEDRWHQPARTALLPWLPALIAAARAAGAYGACLSGAGPTVLALTPTRPGSRQAVGRALAAAAARAGLAGRVMLLPLAAHGLLREPLAAPPVPEGRG